MVLVTGWPESGKTFWARELALYWSTQAPVLVIDLNDARPGLEEAFHIDVDSVFDRFDFYDGICDFSKAARRIAQNLDFIPASFTEDKAEGREERLDLLADAGDHVAIIVDCGNMDSEAFKKCLPFGTDVVQICKKPIKPAPQALYPGVFNGMIINRMEADQIAFYEKELYLYEGLHHLGTVPYDLSIEASMRRVSPVGLTEACRKKVDGVCDHLIHQTGQALQKPGFFQRLLAFFGLGDLAKRRKQYD